MRRLVLALGLCAAVFPVAGARAQDAGTDKRNPTAGASASAAHRGLVVHSGAHHRHATHVHPGPVATLPGFQMLPEGGSRLFVELTQPVRVDEHRSRGKIVYVLHGARVDVRNNENPLVTVHFNTPVSRARLVPHGRDLHFVVDLRARVTPTWKTNPGKDGSFVLTIDFPKGTYIHGAPSR